MEFHFAQGEAHLCLGLYFSGCFSVMWYLCSRGMVWQIPHRQAPPHPQKLPPFQTTAKLSAFLETILGLRWNNIQQGLWSRREFEKSDERALVPPEMYGSYSRS